MEQDREIGREAVRLPRGPDRGADSYAGAERERGLRSLRRTSNWTLAALLVGVGATSAALAHGLPAATAPPSATVQAGTSAATTASGTANAPGVSSPVATTSASGVTTSATASTTGGAAGSTQRAVATSGGS